MSATAVMTYVPDQSVPPAVPIDEPDDRESLRRYAAGGAEAQEAFAAIVRRHIDMVYGSARRQVGDSHLAEDVTQAVFMVLSRRAAKLDEKTVLVGWLYNTSRYCAANARKLEARRKFHEAKGGVMDRITPSAENRFDEALPLLDTALAALGERDRDAVLLKYIAGKTHKAVGEALGVSEEAARKRVDRAVDRLRGFFMKRGIAVSGVAVAGMLGTATTEAAPPALAATLVGSAGGAGTAVAGATSGAIAQGALLAMALAKMKVAAIVIVGALLLGTTATVTVLRINKPPRGAVATNAAGRPSAPAAAAGAPAKPPAPVARPAVVVGVVKSLSGESLAGARVSLGTRDRHVDVYSDRFTGAAQATTADDGFFSFNAGDRHAYVVVTHELGYAQITREQLAAADGVVSLQPWARVEGIAKVGSKPAAGETIVLQRVHDWGNPYSRMVHLYVETTADAQGRYVFDRVAPGDTWVGRQRLTPMPHLVTYQFLETQPGKTVRVNLGGTGRPVIGKLTLPPGSDEKIAWAHNRTDSFLASICSPQRAVVSAADPGPEADLEQIRARREQWLKTPEGRHYQRARCHWSFWIQADGSFRIEDVPTGAHRMGVQAHREDGAGFHELVATFGRLFAVPEVPGGQSDEPLDLGTAFLMPEKHLRMGHPAPDFAAESSDGRQVKLSDFRGKMLVLHFLGPGNEPSAQELEQLKLVAEKHSKDVAILGVNFGDKADFTRQFAQRHGVTWPLVTSRFGFGLIDTVRGTAIPPQYNPYPSRVFLIDPDGNVAAKNIPPDQIESAVGRELFLRK